MDATSMQLFAEELCADLQFKQNTSDKFEAAINDLAWFIGISAQRPEKNFDEGPDNLWALANGTFLVVECKNGVTSNSGISKKDAGQLGQSVAWFNQRYMSSNSVPVLVHPDRTCGDGASRVVGMRIIDVSGLEKIRRNLRAFAKQLVDPDVAARSSEVAKRLAQYEFSSDAFVNAFSTQPK
jgi:hypothetical protein